MYKRFYSFLPVFLLMSSLTTGQTLRFDEDAKNFGQIRSGNRAKLTYTFYNTGADTIRLLDPKPSCGCTAVVLKNRLLAPGDSGTLGVEFHAARGMYGRVSKRVTMYGEFYGEKLKLGMVQVKGSVVGDLKYEPGMLRFETTTGTPVSVEATLISNTDKTMILDNISVDLLAYIDTTAGPRYHADKVISRPFTDYTLELEHEELAPGDSTRVKLELRPMEKGQINGAIRVGLGSTDMRIPVVGVVIRE